VPIILLCSVVQGWTLYALHVAIQNHHWPATEPGWLLALYAVFAFVPVALELMAAQTGKRLTWWFAGGLTLVLFYVGWFNGRDVAGIDVEPFAESGTIFPLALELPLFCLVLLPFLQSRLQTGSWRPDYQQLFNHAWRNKLTLAEAALFTALFWALLGLWQALFHLLAIDYFRELFQEPAFCYPITALVFGIAMHLIGSLEQWARTVLDQLLSVLKWLGPVAAVILALFALALVPKLSTLVFAGHRAIDAGWLLWLVAVVVLFLNAAFRDGSLAQPYPPLIGRCLRVVTPLLIIVTLTAIYALWVRSREYGLTVERYWAFVVGSFALIYSLGYSWAALGSDAWMARIAPVNVCAALLMLAILVMALTPILTPYRLAASSQYQAALRGKTDTQASYLYRLRESPVQYLRFSAGEYGLRRLHELADDEAIAPELRSLATRALAAKSPWEFLAKKADPQTALAKLPIYPSGAVMTAALHDELVKEFGSSPRAVSNSTNGDPVAGLFVDLNGDGVDEFVLLWTLSARAYQLDQDHWRELGRMYGSGGTIESLLPLLEKNEAAAQRHVWQDLKIGNRLYRFYQDPTVSEESGDAR
jgi:hypothetical protein